LDIFGQQKNSGGQFLDKFLPEIFGELCILPACLKSVNDLYHFGLRKLKGCWQG